MKQTFPSNFKYHLGWELFFRGKLHQNNLPSSVKNGKIAKEFKLKLRNSENITALCTVLRLILIISLN